MKRRLLLPAVVFLIGMSTLAASLREHVKYFFDKNAFAKTLPVPLPKGPVDDTVDVQPTKHVLRWRPVQYPEPIGIISVPAFYFWAQSGLDERTPGMEITLEDPHIDMIKMQHAFNELSQHTTADYQLKLHRKGASPKEVVYTLLEVKKSHEVLWTGEADAHDVTDMMNYR